MTEQQVMVALKRVYDEPAPGDGTRVLVERLWPRGLSKERAQVDVWLKEIAPSPQLRPRRCAKRWEHPSPLSMVLTLNVRGLPPAPSLARKPLLLRGGLQTIDPVLKAVALSRERIYAILLGK
jgi:hypothetical protein